MFAEVKSWVVADSQWDQMRRHADHYGHKCIAILVVEHWAEEQAVESLGVRVYTSEDQKITDITWGGEEYLERVLTYARDIHGCWE